jgi:tetratricopeptide (TPR) repeat protein
MPGGGGVGPAAGPGGAPSLPPLPGGAAGPAAGPTAAPKPAGDAQALAKEALRLKHAGQYDAAAAKFSEVLAADPKNALAHWGMAWIMAEQGTTYKDADKIAKAKSEFKTFLTLSKDAKKVAEARRALKRLEAK